MKQILLLFMFVIAASCGGGKNAVDNHDYETYGNRMFNLYERLFTLEQFDSICLEDVIPSDMSLWHKSSFRDYETKLEITEYLYIKSLGERETIYRVEKAESNAYKISKRVVTDITK